MKRTIAALATASLLGSLLALPAFAQEETTITAGGTTTGGATAAPADEPPGAGPSTEIGPPGERGEANAADIQAPPGYEVEPVAMGLTYATSVAFGPNGETYVAEAGGHTYGTSPEKAPPPRILKILPDGSTEVVFEQQVPLAEIRNAQSTADMPEGLIAPITGLTYNPDDGLLYVAHRTRVSTLDPHTGEFRTIVDDLPAWGEFQNNKVIFGSDGRMYFFVSTQGNSGPVGGHMLKVLEAYNKPNKSEVPCEDVTLTGEDFPTPNKLSGGKGDEKLTGAYVPFGVQTEPGQVIQGQTKCNGAFLRANPDGSGLEVYAWGLRSDFGYRFAEDGRLISSQNSGNPIPPREIFDDYETIYEVREGAWYGWPDYYSGIPITDERFLNPEDPDYKKKTEPNRFVLTEETRERLLRGKELPPQPLVKLKPHTAAQGFVFGEPFGFGYDDILLAEFGTVVTYLRDELPGFRVSRVNLATGEATDFLVNKSGKPASATGGGGLERPIQLEYAPDGSLYLVDFGVINITEKGMNATPNTGVLWRVTRTAGGAMPETGGLPVGYYASGAALLAAGVLLALAIAGRAPSARRSRN
ncbi:MAG: hypothetical protein M3R38_25225 [Actinomycetota bacterium]|nr:hypothetical protein [Actinomycetota bacterium]